jgi:hypothetical protein
MLYVTKETGANSKRIEKKKEKNKEKLQKKNCHVKKNDMSSVCLLTGTKTNGRDYFL